MSVQLVRPCRHQEVVARALPPAQRTTKATNPASLVHGVAAPFWRLRSSLPLLADFAELTPCRDITQSVFVLANVAPCDKYMLSATMAYNICYCSSVVLASVANLSETCTKIAELSYMPGV